MDRLPARLKPIVRTLLDESAVGDAVTLDRIGEAIGTVAVSADDVEAMLTALEHAGRRVTGPEGGGLTDTLKKVLVAARDLAVLHGRKPTVGELALRTGYSRHAVRTALSLGRVMGR